MGSKIEAKRLMRAAGVPVLEVPDEPTDADLPLLVKASAGGGGRGMRVVRRLADLPGEVAAAEAEALSAFGDGTVFLEPYVEHGRHVEVQVVGGRDGVLVLGERDCSIQRRHQKVLEETPAPALPDETRAALHDAGRRVAEAIDYRGAGTVEFLVDAREPRRFWFLEMNTRLQVEHPVTELVWDTDLVELQLQVAETGSWVPRRGLGHPQADDPHGHAIEVRLYAEDPAADYQPQSGVLHRFEIPAGEGIRVDAGYESGSGVSTFYDAMLAKVVCHAPSREAAARKLADTLARSRIHGVTTNRDLLVGVLRSEAFVAGRGVDRLPGRPGSRDRRERAFLDQRACRGRGDRARRAGRRRAHRPARDPGRLAQRAQPAAAHRVRGRDRRRVVARPGRLRRRRARRSGRRCDEPRTTWA